MENETATATTNPTDATATTTTDASVASTASAGDGADTTQQTQTAETQTATTAEATTTATPNGESQPSGAPEQYTFTAPEGTTYDSAVLDAFSGAAKEANLSQDAAQKLIEKMAPALAAHQVGQVGAIHKEWRNASSADKEFGGEKLAENLGVARKALDNFGSPELRKLLDDTGLGNHPEVIRLLFRAGRAISEDKFVGGNAVGAAKPNPASILYDKTKTA